MALDAIGAEASADVLRAVVEQAKAGDMRAAEILLRRVWPERKGRPVELPDLPTLQRASDLPVVFGAITQAVVDGRLSPEEAQALAGIAEAHRRAIETAELAERIASLESRQEFGS